jgi:hypothetical protein
MDNDIVAVTDHDEAGNTALYAITLPSEGTSVFFDGVRA